MTDDLTDPRAVSALRSVAHPVRLRILSLLTAEAMSAAEVSRTLGLTHANASYHLRVLLDAGELFVESEESVRGGVAKRYRYRVGGAPDRPASPHHAVASHHAAGDRIAWQTATHSEIVRRLAASTTGPGTSADIETWVRPEIWQQAMDAVVAAMNLLHDQAQPPGTDGTIHVSASTQGFVMEERP